MLLVVLLLKKCGVGLGLYPRLLISKGKVLLRGGEGVVWIEACVELAVLVPLFGCIQIRLVLLRGLGGGFSYFFNVLLLPLAGTSLSRGFK